jgi:hypothetical protein
MLDGGDNRRRDISVLVDIELAKPWRSHDQKARI